MIPVELLLESADIRDVSLSPDGTLVAYVLERAVVDIDGYRSAIWVVGAGTGEEPRQLTHADESVAGPAWSPDGLRLAFTSDRGGGAPQIHVLDMRSGDARQLTHLEGAVSEPRWSPDGTQLLFSAEVVESASEALDGVRRTGRAGRPATVQPARHKTDGVASLGRARRQVLRVDSTGGEPQQLTDGDGDASEATWSPDGTRIAFARYRAAPRESSMSDLWVMAADGSDQRRLTETVSTASSPSWSPDGERIACYGSVEPGDPMSTLWAVYAEGGEAPRELLAACDRDIAVIPGTTLHAPIWSTDSRALFVVVADEGGTRIVRVDAARGDVESVLGGDQFISALTADAARERIAFTSMDPWGPAEVFSCGVDGSSERCLTSHNAGWSAVEWPATEKVRFELDGGDEVEGWLVRPHEGGAAPLLIEVHDGPRSFATPNFRYHPYHYRLGSEGWAVLSLNTVGSSSYGRAFAGALHGSLAAPVLEQYAAVIEELVRSGIVDSQRIAIAGRSYGGYVAVWAARHREQVRAAVVTAPMADPESHCEPGGQPPPVDSSHRAAAPTLFLQGEEDHRRPLGRSEELFRRMLRESDAECELVIYPGGDHRFAESGRPSHRVDYNLRIVDWLRRHVSGGS